MDCRHGRSVWAIEALKEVAKDTAFYYDLEKKNRLIEKKNIKLPLLNIGFILKNSKTNMLKLITNYGK